ncbi:hypothetical protein IFR05_017486, partial [Cadophora sp. M221]
QLIEDILTGAFIDDYFQVKSRKYAAHGVGSWGLDRALLDPIIDDFLTKRSNKKQTLQKLFQLEPLNHVLVNHGGQSKDLERPLLAYLKIHLPNNAFRFASTTKYLLEEEGCVIATRNISVGEVIDNLEGWRVPLSEEEDRNLAKEGRNFSVLERTHYFPSSLLIAPVHMLNHSCEPNAEMQVMGELSQVKVIARRYIKKGDEITVGYGSNYFGEGCLCERCQKDRGRAAVERGEGKQAGLGTTTDYVEDGIRERTCRATRKTSFEGPQQRKRKKPVSLQTTANSPNSGYERPSKR